jgi:Tfp pilus assembly protein PilV
MENKIVNNKKDRLLTGFTIIELIITIFILSIAVIGIFGAFSIMVVLTSNISDRLTASYLAQEGVEIIRNIRDSNWLKMDENPDLFNLDDEIEKCYDSGCQVDYKTFSDTSPVMAYSGSYLNIEKKNSEEENIQENSFFYGYGSGEKTKFKRKIVVEPEYDADGKLYMMKVIVEVFWDEKPSLLNLNKTEGNIKIENTLYNWYNHNE